MKIRIMGTGTEKYLKNFVSVPKEVNQVITINEGLQYIIADQKTKNSILSFGSDVTRRQNLEVWTVYGWSEPLASKHILITTRDEEELIEIAKENLLKNQSNDLLQAFVNTKMLAIESLTRKISDEELEISKVKQVKGKFKSFKLAKECSVVEKAMSKDLKFLQKMRKVLYEQINKEL